MDNKYKDYSDQEFEYSYPYTWEERNKEYLKKRDDRELLETPDILKGY